MARVIIAVLKILLSLMKVSTAYLGKTKNQSGTIESLLGLKSEAPLTMVDIELKRFAYHPEGNYQMWWRESPRFGETWHVKEVEDRTWILIHAANYPKDVQGCIGLGTGLMSDRVAVSNSRKAVAKFEKLTRDLEWRLIVKHAPHAGLSRS
jgi:hypothetical protein